MSPDDNQDIEHVGPRGGDDDVRDLLERTVAGVEPRGGLRLIRERTRSADRRRQWRWAAGGAAAVAATVAAVVVLGGLPGTTSAPEPGPATSTTEPSLTPETGRLVLPVFFLGDTPAGTRLYQENRRGDGVEDALRLALAGDAFDADYRSSWPADTSIESFETGAGETDTIHLAAESDLTARPAGLSAADAAMSVQQLVRTAEAGELTAGRSVRFVVDGDELSRLLGVDVSSPVRPGDGDAVMAPVLIDNIPAQVRARRLPPLVSPFTVRGRAAAFEANVQWELSDGDTVVRRGFTTARECCTLSPYSFTVTAPPGEYVLVVHGEDASGEGRPVAQDTKEIVVR